MRQLTHGQEVRLGADGPVIRFSQRSKYRITQDGAPRIAWAAGGPRALAAAGRVADEVVIGHADAHLLRLQLEHVRSGAAQAGRPMPTITLFVGLYLATESPTDAQLQASMGSHVPNMLASNFRSALPHVDELGALGASFANYGALQKGWELRADELDRYAHSLSDEYASVTDSAALHAKILSGSVQSLGARIEELEALGANRCVFFPDRTDPGWFDTACRVVPALSRIAAPRAP